jgi:hypothetical protein
MSAVEGEPDNRLVQGWMLDASYCRCSGSETRNKLVLWVFPAVQDCPLKRHYKHDADLERGQDHFCPSSPANLHAMKNLSETVLERDRKDVIVMSGQGRLVRLSPMRVGLWGGSRDDQIEAGSWLAMLRPEVTMPDGRPR